MIPGKCGEINDKHIATGSSSKKRHDICTEFYLKCRNKLYCHCKCQLVLIISFETGMIINVRRNIVYMIAQLV